MTPYVLYGAGILTVFLSAITFAAGWPTNDKVPNELIVYGLTSEYIWAAPIHKPFPPRAYEFEAPSEWFEERDKRKGHPFEVKRRVDQGNEQYPETEWEIVEFKEVDKIQ